MQQGVSTTTLHQAIELTRPIKLQVRARLTAELSWARLVEEGWFKMARQMKMSRRSGQPRHAAIDAQQPMGESRRMVAGRHQA
jgi:hypothetical protein